MHYNCLNEVMNGKMSVKPEVGMLGTMFVGSDRYVVICSKVLSPKKVMVLEHVWREEMSEMIIEKNGVQYLPEEFVTQLYENDVPNLERFIEREKRYAENHNREFDLAEATVWATFEMDRYLKSHTYSLRKNLRWMPKGSDAWGTGSIHWGQGEEYLDPSF